VRADQRRTDRDRHGFDGTATPWGQGIPLWIFRRALTANIDETALVEKLYHDDVIEIAYDRRQWLDRLFGLKPAGDGKAAGGAPARAAR
jgi:hypothetical protein